MRNRMRRLLHVAVAIMLHYTGVLNLVAFLRRRLIHRPIIYVLAFHRVLAKEEEGISNSLPGMIISQATFLDLLDYLSRKFRFISLDRVLTNGAEAPQIGEPLCLVTFDDAWGDTYRRAAPALQRLNIPAVVFVPTSAIGSHNGFWVEQLTGAYKREDTVKRISAKTGGAKNSGCHCNDIEETVEFLKHMPAEKRDEILSDVLPAAHGNGVDAMMTWDQVIAVSNRGFEIGSHTATHPLLTCEDDATRARELISSRTVLRDKLAIDVRAFAYPNGDWNSKVRESVIRAGYLCAFTTKAACYAQGGDLYSIPRFLLHEGNVTGFRGHFSRAMTNLTLAGWA